MTAFKAADILLPKLPAKGMEKWSVVACDQYTGEPQYWEKTAELTKGAPTALELILPEIYLNAPDAKQRAERVNLYMRRYLNEGLFEQFNDSMILVRRRQADGRVRLGLIGQIDLEEYDYRKGSKSQVRATEATVPERIPPRVAIRKDAPLELPHIMVLIDDPQKTVIEPLEEKMSGIANVTKLYDFELMLGGGHIEGALLDKDSIARVNSALEKLADKDAFNRRYGLSGEDVLLYAMGDGNHSLATAKECYEIKKREGSPDAELARYALVELVNLHSEALEFEAIHRVITGVDTGKLMSEMEKALGLSESTAGQSFRVILSGKETDFSISNTSSNLTVGTLQNFLDGYLKENAGSIDYIHGENVVRELCRSENTIGFLLPSMKKEELFPTVIKDGALPRKTFSMGHANDKRFYLEARRISF